MDEQQNPYLIRIIKHMCDVIDVDYTTIDCKEDGWYEKHTWTIEQEDNFLMWLSSELYNNEAMREELLTDPERSIENCFTAAVHFVGNFGWDTEDDVIDRIEEIEETKLK